METKFKLFISIYHENVKHLNELDIDFRVSQIADICPHYKIKVE